jgi:hypothetical protein
MSEAKLVGTIEPREIKLEAKWSSAVTVRLLGPVVYIEEWGGDSYFNNIEEAIVALDAWWEQVVAR